MPKRRRVDESSSPIAQTNATLHQFLGSRQSSWMLPGGHEDGGGNGESTSAAAVEGRSVQAAQQNLMRHNSNAAMSRPTVLPSTFSPHATTPTSNGSVHTASGTSAEPIDLVDYESPYAMNSLPTPSPLIAHTRTRVAPTGVNGQTLPSPALSDGSTPPTAARRDSAPPRRGRGRPPKLQPSLRIPRTITASPTMAAPLQGMNPSYPLATHPFTVLPSNDLHQRQDPRVPTPTSATNRGPPPILRSTVAPPMSPSVQSPHGHAQPYSPQAHPNAANPFNKASMLQGYNGFFDQPGLILNETDVGRKIMLLDAIQREDFFYLILSQMFCLQTVLSNYMPQELSGLPDLSWKTLKRLLRGNDYCSPNAVNWFANFPAPVHVIYASGVRAPYVQQLVAIRNFLIQLPAQLEPLIETSRKRLAPPLTQDMAETLSLPSPVLQTTLFRMIARLFWGSNDNKGLQTLEQIHRIDQDTYFFNHYRRTASEMATAYQALASVYRNFHALISAGYNLQAFSAPHEVAHFQQQPASMPRAPQALAPAQQIQMLQQQYAQHIQGDGPPSNPPAIPRPPSVPHYAQQQPPVPPRHLTRLMPGDKDQPRSQPVQPDTVRVTLHQARLRSPVPGPKEPPPKSQSLYRHVIGYALNPTQWHASSFAQTISFNLTQEDVDKIPKISPPEQAGDRGTRMLNEESILYRLRCSEMPKQGFQTENAWVTADNVWPSNMSCELNGQYVDLRRKLHHGRYLPADLSSLLHAGINNLTMYVIGEPKTPLAIAVEVVGVSSHASILSSLRLQSSSDSLNAIKRSLAGESGGGGDDDDIIMASSTLTINLLDPFTADRICATPVRGSACLHRDCFDLETFLSQCKREKPGYPCIVDCWRCPICKSDVRPQTLLKDGFLVEVRKELEKRGLLNTRAIIVAEDGSWKPKAEEETIGVRSPSLVREEAEAARAKSKKVVEIIELD